jgi:hypothetical protein
LRERRIEKAEKERGCCLREIWESPATTACCLAKRNWRWALIHHYRRYFVWVDASEKFYCYLCVLLLCSGVCYTGHRSLYFL